MAQGTLKQKNTYDAIVIGSGISDGWAAKELCEQGLKTLVLERGRMVEHDVDYPTATKNPWEFAHRGELPLEVIRVGVIKCYPPAACIVKTIQGIGSQITQINGLRRSLTNNNLCNQPNPFNLRSAFITSPSFFLS